MSLSLCERDAHVLALAVCKAEAMCFSIVECLLKRILLHASQKIAPNESRSNLSSPLNSSHRACTFTLEGVDLQLPELPSRAGLFLGD